MRNLCVLFVCVLAMGCSQINAEQNQKGVIVKDNNKGSTAIYSKSSDKKVAKMENTTLINGNKISYKGTEIRLGQRVTDLTLNSSATATGTFFVKGIEKLDLLQDRVEVTKVFKHGVSLRAVSRSDNLLRIYQLLVKRYGNTKVEMSLFYSKPSKRESM